MKSCNNTPPVSIRNKDKWIEVERRRWAEQLHIPMVASPPAGFPVLTLQTQRALCALEIGHPELMTGALDALYQAHWAQGDSSVGQLEGVGKVLNAVLGEEVVKDGLGKAAGKEAKDRLAENTERAFKSGAFGLPWFECENERGEQQGFWGVDHLGQVVRFLGLEGRVELERSADMRAML